MCFALSIFKKVIDLGNIVTDTFKVALKHQTSFSHRQTYVEKYKNFQKNYEETSLNTHYH